MISMKTLHLVMSIEWLERQLNKKSELKRNKYCIQSFWLNYEQVKEWLEKYKAKWYTVIPWAWCDNILPDWRCWWH
jgi:hypothetical protein